MEADGRVFRFRSPENASRSVHACGMLGAVEEWITEDDPPRTTRWIQLLSRRMHAGA